MKGREFQNLVYVKAVFILMTVLLVSCEGTVNVSGLKKSLEAYSVEYTYPSITLNPGDGQRVEPPFEIKCFGPGNVEVDISNCQIPSTLPTKIFLSPSGFGPSYTDADGNTVRDYFGVGGSTATASEPISCHADRVLVGNNCVLPFRFRVNIASTGDYLLPLTSNASLRSKYNFTIDWGDGTSETISNPSGTTFTHNYSTTGITTITITGIFPVFNGSPMGAGTNLKSRITEVVSLGDVQWEDLSQAFRSTNLIQSFNARGDTSNVTTMRQMFNSTRGLTTLNLSNLDTSKVTDMSSMFQGASDLTSLNLGGIFDTSAVQKMGNMFNGLLSLTTLDLSGFDTREVDDMSSMFLNSQITNLDLSSFRTSKVTTMNSMFLGAASTTINISNFNTSTVVNMGNMFTATGNLTSLIFPSVFSTAANASMSAMFSGSGFTSLDLSSFDTSKVINMGGMFSNMPYVTSINLSNFDTANVTDMIAMFSGLSQVTSLNINHFDTSEVLSMEHMFSGSAQLTSLDLGGWDTRKVSNFSSMFSGTQALVALDISGFNFASAPNVGSGLFTSTSFLNDSMISKTINAINVTFPDNFTANMLFDSINVNRGIMINVNGAIFPQATTYNFGQSNTTFNQYTGYNYFCSSVPANVTGMTCLSDEDS